MPPLSIMLWLPAACALLGMLLSVLASNAGFAEEHEPAGEGPAAIDASRWSISGGLAVLGALGVLGLSIGYIADYSPSDHGLRHVTDVVWIAELGIHYKLGVDGLNVFLIGLTALLFLAAALAANLREWDRPRFFY